MRNEIAKYQKIASTYAKEQGFDTCKFEKEWKGRMAFQVSRKMDSGACVGLPSYALVDRKSLKVEIISMLLVDEDAPVTPEIDFSSHEALDAWIEKYGD